MVGLLPWGLTEGWMPVCLSDRPFSLLLAATMGAVAGWYSGADTMSVVPARVHGGAGACTCIRVEIHVYMHAWRRRAKKKMFGLPLHMQNTHSDSALCQWRGAMTWHGATALTYNGFLKGKLSCTASGLFICCLAHTWTGRYIMHAAHTSAAHRLHAEKLQEMSSFIGNSFKPAKKNNNLKRPLKSNIYITLSL